MNAAVGGTATLGSQADPRRQYINATKLSDLDSPGPSEVFVTLDEHHESINDATFHVIPGLLGPNMVLRDVPASYHYGGGANFAFADGHSEIKIWKTGAFKKKPASPPISKSGSAANVPVRGSVDYQWLTDHMPYIRK